MNYKVEKIYKDILIIGGGAAGIFAANRGVEIDKKKSILIVDKAHVKRSGCLASGINAINAYLKKDEGLDYLENIRHEFSGIIRDDLVLTIGERLEDVTKKVESFGLTILKDEKGEYKKRGKRSIKINGENIKEILYSSVCNKEGITILNNVNIAEYIKKNGKIIGAIGFSVKENKFYIIYSRCIICTTGGCSKIYKNNMDKKNKNKMWYSPFNLGGGLAMGIRNGAEMTSFEFRFVALRIKDTIAPTGTIAQGIKGEMVNIDEELYEEKYSGPKTVRRLYGAIKESEKGKGPCFIKTRGIDKNTVLELKKAYLNMAPVQVLYWKENNIDIRFQNVEISGTEPYIVGGHSVSGYFVDTKRRTSIKGLYAAGDVVGGSGKKYVTGAFVEGEIAIETALKDIEGFEKDTLNEDEEKELVMSFSRFFENIEIEDIEKLEEEMQDIMDRYCGGISTNYRYTEEGLKKAKPLIKSLLNRAEKLKANDFHELLFIRELIDRLYVAMTLIEHMKARKERRIPIYNENLSYPSKDEKYDKYCNTRFEGGEEVVIYKDLIGGEGFEYSYK